MHESLEKVLRANPGQNYCASCLADAVGLGAPEDRTPIARILRSAYTKVNDRVVESGAANRGDVIMTNFWPYIVTERKGSREGANGWRGVAAVGGRPKRTVRGCCG